MRTQSPAPATGAERVCTSEIDLYEIARGGMTRRFRICGRQGPGFSWRSAGGGDLRRLLHLKHHTQRRWRQALDASFIGKTVKAGMLAANGQADACTMELRLYVAGGSAPSMRAMSNIETLCADSPLGVSLHVIDVIERPLAALADGVLVTPTLLKVQPGPVLRLVGDLSELELVRCVLGLGCHDGRNA